MNSKNQNVTKFEVGKTYTAGWQNFKFTVVSRTDKTVTFAEYWSLQPNWHGAVEKFRRKICYYDNGSEFVERCDIIDKDIPISSERIYETDVC